MQTHRAQVLQCNTLNPYRIHPFIRLKAANTPRFHLALPGGFERGRKGASLHLHLEGALCHCYPSPLCPALSGHPFAHLRARLIVANQV